MVWIECLGIPPNLWSRENITKLGEIWGSVICFNLNTHTRNMNLINHRILVQIDEDDSEGLVRDSEREVGVGLLLE